MVKLENRFNLNLSLEETWRDISKFLAVMDGFYSSTLPKVYTLNMPMDKSRLVRVCIYRSSDKGDILLTWFYKHIGEDKWTNSDNEVITSKEEYESATKNIRKEVKEKYLEYIAEMQFPQE